MTTHSVRRSSRPNALPPTWFVSAAHARHAVVAGETQRRPFGGHHARAFGMTATACGLPAFYWVNFYELPYEPMAAGSCRSCDAALSGAAPQ